jgi:hypothetical protein
MVPEASARRCAGHNFWVLDDCDHFTVCKPIDKSHRSYKLLVEVIRDCQQKVSSIDSMNPFVSFLLITTFPDVFDILG